MITLQNLCYRYHRGPQILQNLCFQADSGSSVLIVGANGSGKSTLGRLICGLQKPSSGSIRINGRPPHRVRGRARVALARYIPQRPREMLIESSVRQDLEEGARRGGSAAGLLETAHAFQIQDLLERHPLDLPQAAAWRAALCVGYLGQPQVLFIDEVVGQSSDLVRHLLTQTLRQRSVAGKATLIAVHSDSLAADLKCDIVEI